MWISFNRLQINEVFKKLSETGRVKFKELSSIEWNIVHDYIHIMKPIAISLDKLQGGKNVSIGSVLACVYFIKSEIALVNLKTSDSNVVKIRNVGNDMKKAVQNAFEKRFSGLMKFQPVNKELILASISHPVYKFKWIVEEENIVIARNFLEQEMQNMCPPIIPLENEEIQDSDDEFLLNHNIMSSTRRLSCDNNAANEIFNFLEDREKPLSMLNKYPLIKEVFKKYNTTSSAPIERLFSQALIICTPRRNRMSCSNFERTLLVKKNKELLKI